MNSIDKNFDSQMALADMPMSRTKSIAIPAILIAIGAVLRMFSPNIFGITPNFVIAMYCLSIILLRPTLRSTIGIGIVAGAVCMMFSKSPIPALNLITEPVGAIACFLIVKYLPSLSIRKFTFKPVVATLIGTLCSGTLYVFLNFNFAMQLPFAAMKAAFIGVVIPVSIINAILAQVLYVPCQRFMK